MTSESHATLPVKCMNSFPFSIQIRRYKYIYVSASMLEYPPLRSFPGDLNSPHFRSLMSKFDLANGESIHTI